MGCDCEIKLKKGESWKGALKVVIVEGSSGAEEMATYSIFRHTTWRIHAMISRCIASGAVVHAPCWPFPLLRSRPSPACARGAPLRNSLRGGLDGTGFVACRIRVRWTTFFPLFVLCHFWFDLSNHFTLGVSGSNLLPPYLLARGCNSHSSVESRSANVFCLRDVRFPPYIIMYPCLGLMSRDEVGACLTEFF